MGVTAGVTPIVQGEPDRPWNRISCTGVPARLDEPWVPMKRAAPGVPRPDPLLLPDGAPRD